MKNRGFVITIAAVILFTSFYLYSMNYQKLSSEAENEKGMLEWQPRIAGIADNVSYNISAVSGVTADYNADLNIFSFAGLLPSDFNSARALAYRQIFLSDSNSGCSRYLGLNSLVDGNFTVSSDSNISFVVDYASAGNSAVMFSENADRNSAVLKYKINFYVNADRNSYSAWSCAGNCSFPVDVNYSDSSGSVVNSYLLDPLALNQFTVYYDSAHSQYVRFDFGRVFYANSSAEIRILENLPNSKTANYRIDYTPDDMPLNQAIDANLSISCGDYSYSGNIPLSKSFIN